MFGAFFIGPTPTAKGTHGSLLIPPLIETQIIKIKGGVQGEPWFPLKGKVQGKPTVFFEN